MWFSWNGSGMRSHLTPGATSIVVPGAGGWLHGWSRVMPSSVTRGQPRLDSDGRACEDADREPALLAGVVVVVVAVPLRAARSDTRARA
jgi:hypothetical protein